MKYRFEIPREFKIDRKKAVIIHGGYCPSPNVIYVYGYGTTEGEAVLYEHIVEHEHLHAVLHKFNIEVQHHEKILRAMEEIKFSRF